MPGLRLVVTAEPGPAASAPVDAASVAAWTRYWQDGHLASCDGAAAEAALPVWQEVAGLCPPGGSLLELGCGNGTLLRRLAGLIAGRRLTGIDRAEILPAPDLPDLALQGGIAIEELPFADCAFDIVISQYAIEYSDWPRGIYEMMRVLRPGGQFRLLLHSRGSAIVERSRRQADALGQLLAGPLPGALAGTMQALAAAAQAGPGEAIEQARTATAQLAALLNEAASRPQDPDASMMMAATLDAIRAAPRAFAAMPPEAALAKAADLQRRLSDQLQRFADLARAALDPPAITRLTRLLAQSGAHAIGQEAATVRGRDGLLAETGVWINGTCGKA